jgi:hypothetical protein
MMKIKSLISLILFLMASNASAQIYNGNQLMEWLAGQERYEQNRDTGADSVNSAIAIGYVVGVTEGLQFSMLICLTPNVTVKQLVSVVHKFMKENPGKWNMEASALVLVAMMRAYPCADKK